MVVQHNLTAMNANRMLGVTTGHANVIPLKNSNLKKL